MAEEGELYTWGSNSEGQLGLEVDEQLTPRLVKVPEPVVSVACGYYHNVAVSGVCVCVSRHCAQYNTTRDL